MIKKNVGRIVASERAIHAFAGFAALSIGLLTVSTHLSLFNSWLDTGLLLVGILSLTLSWIIYVRSSRLRIKEMEKGLGRIIDKLTEVHITSREFKKQLQEVEESLDVKLARHSDKWLSEYRSQAFNTFVSLQDFKALLQEGQESQNEK